MPKAAISAPARICVISLMLSALLFGCGGDDSNAPSNAVESLRVEQFQSDIRFFCTSGKGDLVGAADPLGTVITAVDNLIKIYREDPKATFNLAKIDKRGDKLGLREVVIGKLLTESAATLNKNCGGYGRDQAKRLESTARA